MLPTSELNLCAFRYEGARTAEALAAYVNMEGGIYVNLSFAIYWIMLLFFVCFSLIVLICMMPTCLFENTFIDLYAKILWFDLYHI